MSHILEITESYLRKNVVAIANEIDASPELLKQGFEGLGKLGVLGLRVPERWGGLSVSSATFGQFQEVISRYSGALAFLQTQHQSAAAMLGQSSNTQLQQEYLPFLSQGQRKIGIGFSHLRRSGTPMMVAVAVEGGYQLDGVVPWVTGWDIFDEFIVAATLPDGRSVFGLVPFQEAEGITLSQPMSFCAMTSTNTVTVTFKNWFLPQEKVVSIQPMGWIQENDQKKVLHGCFFALGCARAGLDVVETAFQDKGFSFIEEALMTFETELKECRTAILANHNNTQLNYEKKVQLRAWAIDLAVRCSHAAITVSSGAANLSNHSAQRVYREALVFTVSGQTTGLMEATLRQLKGLKGDRFLTELGMLKIDVNQHNL